MLIDLGPSDFAAARTDARRGVFGLATQRLLKAALLIAVPLLITQSYFWPWLLTESLMIALASVAISVLALVPGLLMEGSRLERRASRRPQPSSAGGSVEAEETPTDIDRSRGSAERERSGRDEQDRLDARGLHESFLTGVIAAMAIRFAGTVALFVACRYQMGLPLETIAFLVCGWYVTLTTLEVAMLASGASEFNLLSRSAVG